MLLLIIRLSALSLGIAQVTSSTTPQQQSQLATLHDRMNQMISALYASPLLSKLKPAAATSEEYASTAAPQEVTYAYPQLPQVVYVATPAFLDPGTQPLEVEYPVTSNPVPRSVYPYPYDPYQTQQYSTPRASYPDPRSYLPPAVPKQYTPQPQPGYTPAPGYSYPPVFPPYPVLPPCVPQPYPSPYTQGPYFPHVPYPSVPGFPPYPNVAPAPFPSIPAPYPPPVTYSHSGF